jgi:hypothetical protein
MPTAAGTLESLALELGKALHPLKDLMRPDIFVRLGTELPSAIAEVPGLTARLLLLLIKPLILNRKYKRLQQL